MSNEYLEVLLFVSVIVRPQSHDIHVQQWRFVRMTCKIATTWWSTKTTNFTEKMCLKHAYLLRAIIQYGLNCRIWAQVWIFNFFFFFFWSERGKVKRGETVGKSSQLHHTECNVVFKGKFPCVWDLLIIYTFILLDVL